MASVEVKRMGLAEKFVENLHGTIPQMLDAVSREISSDIAAESPPHRTSNPKAGDVPLAASFDTMPAQQVGELTWEGYITSSVPAKARALEYGSGLHGWLGVKYPIYPRNARMLSFKKEGRTLVLPMVMHPGVHARHYIATVLERWRPLLAERFGEAIRLAAVPWSAPTI